MKTLSKPARALAKKTTRALAKKTTRAYEPVKNLPPGAIKLNAYDIEPSKLDWPEHYPEKA